MKISCLIVDDEPKALELLEKYIKQVPFLQLQYKCYDAIEALAFTCKYSLDMIFLDINMPQLSGIELAAVLPKGQPIIFTTAYSEYALKGYEYNAIDYLMKPFSFERFLQAVIKANNYLSKSKGEKTLLNNEKGIFIKTGKEIVQLQLDNINYFEGNKEYILVHTSKGKHLIYKRMKELETELPDNFIRIHNSFIVNLKNITKIDANLAYLNNIQLPISQGYKEKFLAAIERKLI